MRIWTAIKICVYVIAQSKLVIVIGIVIYVYIHIYKGKDRRRFKIYEKVSMGY